MSARDRLNKLTSIDDLRSVAERRVPRAFFQYADHGPIAEAVAGTVEILFDGGIRSGQDVLRALALGARACVVGRTAAYGIGAAGEAGMTKALSIIRRQLDVSMALTGTRSIQDIVPTFWQGRKEDIHEVCHVRVCQRKARRPAFPECRHDPPDRCD